MLEVLSNIVTTISMIGFILVILMLIVLLVICIRGVWSFFKNPFASLEKMASEQKEKERVEELPKFKTLNFGDHFMVDYAEWEIDRVQTERDVENDRHILRISAHSVNVNL